ncbi:uncharacterized protein IUM83_19720 [Phytophthora cinnamomi]|uniref:uncharacterized protein n=1 Tax=Phytophthora cinnamomi TaxID=4785 RepID=UPI00355A3932|nr:hypothetical protein IUM83_19720 [Phytophthora cinnamomi]
MDDEDARALAVLQAGGGPLSERAQLRRVATCPHCRQGFGSASLSIHVPRCRALLQTPEEAAEQPEQQRRKPIRRRQVARLVDLCLRFVTKHFEAVCMDKVVAFPEAEAALIASMPPDLVHRMVVALVQDSRRAKAKHREGRATIENLESALQGPGQHVAERLQHELDATKTALALAEADNRKLQSKAETAEKKTLRLDAKINALIADKTALAKAAKEAQRREMEATRLLAAAKKVSITGANSTPRSAGRSESNQHQGQNSLRRRSAESARRGSLRNPTAPSSSAVTLRERPRADGSKIPYPPSA